MLDVCLIVECTRPEVARRASAFASELVEGLPALRFGVVHVRLRDDVAREETRPTGDNLERFEEVAIEERVGLLRALALSDPNADEAETSTVRTTANSRSSR